MGRASSQVADDGGGPEVEQLADRVHDRLRVRLLGAERLDHQGNGMGGPDRVRDLELTAVGEA